MAKEGDVFSSGVPGRVYAIWITTTNKSGWLVIEKIPWYKIGGLRHTIRDDSDCTPTMFTVDEALEIQELYRSPFMHGERRTKIYVLHNLQK